MTETSVGFLCVLVMEDGQIDWWQIISFGNNICFFVKKIKKSLLINYAMKWLQQKIL